MKRAIIILLLVIPFVMTNADNQGYYRFPEIYENTIIFTAEGDLWSVNVDGGIANRLTTNHGIESHPAVSLDGSQLAFSAQYEGPTEVYTIPLNGGIPIRQTYEGESALVIDWTPEGKILYSTRKYSTLPNMQLATIDIHTSKTELIQLSQASDGCFNSLGTTLFFTRLPFQGSHTKRYKGGTAQNLWKYTLGSKEAVPLTSNYSGTSKIPIWWNNRVYFTSDRDGTMNIWSMKEDGTDISQHTFHNGIDVNYSSLYNGRIVYQLVADLYVYDITKNIDRKLSITLASDFDQMRERLVKEPIEYLTSVHISPNGDRVCLTTRGQVFVAPAFDGRLVNISKNSKIRFRDAKFMPDGKSILLLSDVSDELEFWEVPADGTEKGKALTNNGNVLRYEGIPSPDGKMFAFYDKNYRLWIHDIKKGESKRIAVSENFDFFDINWSPDSKWLTYAVAADNWFARINLYNLKGDKTTFLTSDRVESYSTVWSPDGKWLYFLSDRNFDSLVRSPWGSYQPEPFFDKTTKIYMIPLNSKDRSPFLPANEIFIAEKDNDKDSENDTKESDKKKKVKVKIDLQGIHSRTTELPVSPGDYSNLSANNEYIFWIEMETSIERKKSLKVLKIDNKNIEVKNLVEDIEYYELSHDGKKLLVQQDKNLYIIDASDSAPMELSKYQVDLKNWSFIINPRSEWRQMFVDAWRLERDYFYDPNLHGLDYKKLLHKYLPYVDRITDRDELNDLISHLVGELSALHTFVSGGDKRKNQNDVEQGSLGALLTKDVDNEGYRIEHIYKSESDYIDRLSPLAKPELNINEGDIITAINGESVLKVPNPSILLKNQVNKQVLLSINLLLNESQISPPQVRVPMTSPNPSLRNPSAKASPSDAVLSLQRTTKCPRKAYCIFQ